MSNSQQQGTRCSKKATDTVPLKRRRTQNALATDANHLPCNMLLELKSGMQLAHLNSGFFTVSGSNMPAKAGTLMSCHCSCPT